MTIPAEREQHSSSTESFDVLVALWECAMALPQATIEDFRDKDQYLADAARHTRLVADEVLLDQLLTSGMAHPVDVRRGRRPRTTIVRLRPSMAGAPDAKAAQRRKPLPTVEQLRAVLAEVERREQTYVAATARSIADLRGQINALPDDAIAPVVAQLHDVLQAMPRLREEARARALRDVASDDAFALAGFALLISPRVR